VKGNNGTSRAYVQTPNVVSVGREHFQCPDLPGGETEDAGGALSGGDGLEVSGHWDSRTNLVRAFMRALPPVLLVVSQGSIAWNSTFSNCPSNKVGKTSPQSAR
jgi:Leishmanolysin